MGHVRAGSPGKALPVFKALLDANPRMTDVWELYSEALKESDRLPEALEAKKKMVELSPPGATYPLLAVANLCLEMGRADEALQNARLARERGDLAADEVLARAYLVKKDLPAAEAAARAAMEYGRTKKRAHLVMAPDRSPEGESPGALRLIDQAAVLYGKEGVPANFHLLRGDILARMDRLPEAEVEMREEIRLQPRAVPPRMSLALVLASRGRWAEARRMVVETTAAIPRLDAFVKGVATLNYFGDRAGRRSAEAPGARALPGRSPAEIGLLKAGSANGLGGGIVGDSAASARPILKIGGYAPMKALTRLAAIAVLLAIASLPAVAAIEKHKDWDKSPEFLYLATEQEKNAWKSVSSDADAETAHRPLLGEARSGPEDPGQRVPDPVRAARGDRRQVVLDGQGAGRPDGTGQGRHPDRTAEEDQPQGRHRRDASRLPKGSRTPRCPAPSARAERTGPSSGPSCTRKSSWPRGPD